MAADQAQEWPTLLDPEHPQLLRWVCVPVRRSNLPVVSRLLLGCKEAEEQVVKVCCELDLGPMTALAEDVKLSFRDQFQQAEGAG